MSYLSPDPYVNCGCLSHTHSHLIHSGATVIYAYCTFDSHCGTVVSLVAAVCARCITLVLPLVFSPEPLDHQLDLVVRVPLHPHLPIHHPCLVRDIREALVSGRHNSQLPPKGIISVEEPFKFLRTWAFIRWHNTGQGEGEPCNTVQGSCWKRYITAHSQLKHCWEKGETAREREWWAHSHRKFGAPLNILSWWLAEGNQSMK